MSDRLDLEAYFERIGYGGSREPDLRTLRELHRLHPTAIPFENLHTIMGQPVPLDLASLERKLVHDRRGGYCFEHNRLFAEVLESLGFEVQALAARVLFNHGDEPIGPRSHVLLLVRLGAQTYISDVGFGGLTLTGPLLLEPEIEQATPHESFRLTQSGPEYILQASLRDAWQSLYVFDLQVQLPIDFEVANHYVATHPDSFFLTTLMAARPGPDSRYGLFNNKLTIHRAGAEEERRTLATVDELCGVLADTFKIRLPEGDELRAALARLLE